ncbi:xanthine dehydrogenase family protein molybdopterin-binding subunit [Prauserella cavernicola]|uniref:Xanthine dehydrogenase family protein n=1 Tax=Prauserella cavernicola TaxID=2800127 RepID=A0A934R1K6_9PSEU|nr:xanthine dehydrogenase family protein molybdopterin-binding subunit [Prauserella cavernicola]MBK1789194.1 xanthine dehydrogenase family protein [Prauserella cavernicola]
MTASTPAAGIGASTRRRDGAALLTGRARYVDDYRPHGLHYAAVVRSTVAHGRIRSVDVSGAETAPGVVLVLTGEQAARHAGPIPYFISPATRGGREVDIRCLEPELVTYVGQPVAAVVARSRVEAQSAAAAVRVEYDSLPHVLDADTALLPDSPRVYPDWQDNVVFAKTYGAGDAEEALHGADVVVSGEFRIARSTTAPVEPRGYVASWDATDEALTVHGSCQNPHQLRYMLSASLGLAESAIRVVTAKIGGSFGLKMQGLPEETLVCLLSMLSRRPVKWIEDRRESLMSGAREQIHRIRVGAKADGTITGLVNRIVADAGAMTAQAGWAMCNMSASTFPSGYRVPDCRVELRLVATNKPPLSAARGFGKDAAHFVMERAVDLVARRLALDPGEVRRRNFIRAGEFPYRTATGLNIDSGDFAGLLDKAQAAIDYPAVRELQRRRREQGRPLGVGIAFELTPESSDSPGTFVSGFDTTTVRMSLTGRVTVLTGVTSPGGGNDTGIAQIVGAELGVPVEWIDVVQGDTDRCPTGFGNFSGRSMVVGGGSAALAARDVRATLRTVGARLLERDPEACEVVDGTVRSVSEPDCAVPVPEVAHAVLTRAFAAAAEVEPVLESTRAYKPGNIDHRPDELGRIQPYPTYSSCLHIAVVEVDAETGKVDVVDYAMAHDCGTMINPDLVEGQAWGAITMGIGSALTEQLVFDAGGRLVSDRFKSYLLPRAGDVPEFRLEHQVTPSPFTMHGNKGAGEAGVGGAQAAVANAVEDALAPVGACVRSLPLTPPVVLDLIEEATR